MPWKSNPLFLATHIQHGEPYNVSKALLSIVILTACRSGEALAMKWSEVNFKNAVWTILQKK
jgi:integrase